VATGTLLQLDGERRERVCGESTHVVELGVYTSSPLHVWSGRWHYLRLSSLEA
jgi:hypothetical protein